MLDSIFGSGLFLTFFLTKLHRFFVWHRSGELVSQSSTKWLPPGGVLVLWYLCLLEKEMSISLKLVRGQHGVLCFLREMQDVLSPEKRALNL